MGCAASSARADTAASSLNSRRATALAPEEAAAAEVSIRLQQDALDLAHQLFDLNKDKNVKDTYVRWVHNGFVGA
jgi:hypothetical protein